MVHQVLEWELPRASSSTALLTSSSRRPTQGRINEAVARLRKSYPTTKAEIIGYVCNLGDETTLESNIKTLFSTVGQLDHIVFTAGDSLAIKPLDDVDLPFIKQAGMVRFFAPLLVAKYGSKNMPRNTSSTITFTSGGISEHPSPDWTVVAGYMSGLHG